MLTMIYVKLFFILLNSKVADSPKYYKNALLYFSFIREKGILFQHESNFILNQNISYSQLKSQNNFKLSSEYSKLSTITTHESA